MSGHLPGQEPDPRRDRSDELAHDVEVATRRYRRSFLLFGGAFALLGMVAGGTPAQALFAGIVYAGTGWLVAPVFLRWWLTRRAERDG